MRIKMLSTNYSVQVLARGFRTAVRCMCKKPDDIGDRRDGVWNETKSIEKKIERLIHDEEPEGKKTFVKPQQVGTGGQYTDNKHLKPPEPENPIHRTGRILADDIRSLKHHFPFNLLKKDAKNLNLKKHILPDFNAMAEMIPDGPDPDRYIFPSHVDILIIGGGAIGSSIAYFLKEKAKHGLNIAVVEKDKTVSCVPCIFHAKTVIHCVTF